MSERGSEEAHLVKAAVSLPLANGDAGFCSLMISRIGSADSTSVSERALEHEGGDVPR